MARLIPARLGLFYASYFGTVGVWMPFWPAWLASRGLDPATIGLVLATGFWIRVLTNPLIGWVADASGERRRPMVLLGAAAAVGYAGFAWANAPWHYVLLSAATGATFTVLVPFADSLTLARVRSDRIDYGRVRLWGSIAFIATSVGAGRVLSDRSGDLTLWIVLALVAATFLSCVLVPGAPGDPGAKRASLRDVRALITRPKYVLLVLTSALVQSSHAVYYGFATIHWRAAGLSSISIGLLWAEGVIFEILLFYGGKRVLERFRPSTLIALGGAAGLLRWTVLAATTHPVALVAVQGLHALTFAATHLGGVTAIGRWVPGSLSATALTVQSTLVGGLALGLAMSVAGALYDSHAGAAFLFSTALSGAGLAVALVLRKIATPAPAPA